MVQLEEMSHPRGNWTLQFPIGLRVKYLVGGLQSVFRQLGFDELVILLAGTIEAVQAVGLPALPCDLAQQRLVDEIVVHAARHGEWVHQNLQRFAVQRTWHVLIWDDARHNVFLTIAGDNLVAYACRAYGSHHHLHTLGRTRHVHHLAGILVIPKLRGIASGLLQGA